MYSINQKVIHLNNANYKSKGVAPENIVRCLNTYSIHYITKTEFKSKTTLKAFHSEICSELTVQDYPS